MKKVMNELEISEVASTLNDLSMPTANMLFVRIRICIIHFRRFAFWSTSILYIVHSQIIANFIRFTARPLLEEKRG
jgi:hypothetical protein